MSDTERDYPVGPEKPPPHTRLQNGQSGNPGGRSAKNPPVFLAETSRFAPAVSIGASIQLRCNLLEGHPL